MGCGSLDNQTASDSNSNISVTSPLGASRVCLDSHNSSSSETDRTDFTSMTADSVTSLVTATSDLTLTAFRASCSTSDESVTTSKNILSRSSLELCSVLDSSDTSSGAASSNTSSQTADSVLSSASFSSPLISPTQSSCDDPLKSLETGLTGSSCLGDTSSTTKKAVGPLQQTKRLLHYYLYKSEHKENKKKADEKLCSGERSPSQAFPNSPFLPRVNIEERRLSCSRTEFRPIQAEIIRQKLRMEFYNAGSLPSRVKKHRIPLMNMEDMSPASHDSFAEMDRLLLSRRNSCPVAVKKSSVESVDSGIGSSPEKTGGEERSDMIFPLELE